MFIASFSRCWLVVVCTGLLLDISALAADDSLTRSPLIVGDVFDRESGEQLYQEIYFADDSGSISEVQYRLVDGRLLAEKHIDYTEKAGILSFQQRNFLVERRLGVKVIKDSMHDESSQLRLELIHSSVHRSIEVTVLARREEALIVDAGFDPFVRYHWDSLVQGKNKRVQFPLTSKGKLLDMVVAVADCGVRFSDSTCFRVRPDSALLSWLIGDPVFLVYQSDTRKLSRYIGVGNVALANGTIPDIEIAYRYLSDTIDASAVAVGHTAKVDRDPI